MKENADKNKTMTSKFNKINRHDIFYYAFPFFAFLYGLLWVLTIPYECAPDERMRYDVCKYIFEFGKLPRGDDPYLLNNMWGFSYAFLPITGNIISAFFMKIFSSVLPDEKLYIAARLTSVLFFTATAIVSGKIAKKVFSAPFDKVYVIIIAFLPQFTFLGSYLNLDVLGIFAVSAIIYTFIIACESNWNFKNCILLGFSIGFCAITYYNTYSMILVALAFALYDAFKNEKIENKFFFISSRILFVGLAAFVVCGWWFIRNGILYNGDIMGLKATDACARINSLKDFNPDYREIPCNIESLFHMLFKRQWFSTVIKSSIGFFGYMTIPLANKLYYLYGLFFLLGFAGLLFSFAVKIKFNRNISMATQNTVSPIFQHNQKQIIFISLCLCITCLGLNIYHSYTRGFQPQGRYSMPMIPGFMILVVLGWQEGINLLNNKLKTKICIGFIILYTLFSFGIYKFYIFDSYDFGKTKYSCNLKDENTLNILFNDKNEFSTMKFQFWSLENGIDDLVVYDATRNGMNQWEQNVDLRNFNGRKYYALVFLAGKKSTFKIIDVKYLYLN